MSTPESGILDVDGLSKRIKKAVESCLGMSKVAVQGEIVELKHHTSGHCYFTLAGRESRIAGVLFRSDASNVIRWPRPGDHVVVGGRVSTYPQRGIYQLYARRLFPLGQGAASRAREELRQKLMDDGLFDPKRKRALPAFPEKIACVTSMTGAALRDVAAVMSSRCPWVELVLIPALVQGAEAPDEIVRALEQVLISDVDGVLLVRGGGSRGDLNPFDQEDVIRAIARCPVPVVVGVGHEIDETLSDMVADRRAATPSEAAELISPDRLAVTFLLDQKAARLKRVLEEDVTMAAQRLARTASAMPQIVERRIDTDRQKVDHMAQLLLSGARRTVELAASELSRFSAVLDGLSPLAVLGRGYVACQDNEGKPVIRTADLEPGARLSLGFSDGTALCVVDTVEPREGRAYGS
ncbi:MAG: exodeoxyribonuclease VII large subunit [Dethiosulfovibrio peptidovorans]|nr:MAG: exodeoxyribonuclease VII large subunit [Dethiosulfovibrio peptidovorans]